MASRKIIKRLRIEPFNVHNVSTSKQLVAVTVNPKMKDSRTLIRPKGLENFLYNFGKAKRQIIKTEDFTKCVKMLQNRRSNKEVNRSSQVNKQVNWVNL